MLSSVALYARQPIIIAYIALGMALGPSWLWPCDRHGVGIGRWARGDYFAAVFARAGYEARALWNSLRQSTLVALLSTALFAVTGFGVSRLFGFGSQDAVLIGAALIFSSTIIGIKLLPTTVLHHRHLGELMIALLLFQDLMAIIVLVLMESVGAQATPRGEHYSHPCSRCRSWAL